MAKQHGDLHRVFTTKPEERLLAYFIRMTEPRPLRARNKPDWLKRRAEVREKTLAALGLDPMPDRLPLEPHRGGVLERDGYRVERVYWQTWPQVWASGWLYLPEGGEGRRPAVLNPHGHFENGARHPTVQSRLISLAKLGYVALAVDSLHLYDYAVGVTPLTAMTYNNLRALDYLQSRPDVDRDRIGLTGASGGAQQSMYLVALDDRVRAAVFAVMITHFRRIVSMMRHHCACNHIPGIAQFTDEPELCGVFAPRAALYLTVTEDWTAGFPEQELGELHALYSTWQQPDRLAHRQFEGPHDYNREMREAAYTWFERELRGNRKVEPVPEPEHAVETLATLQSLDAPPDGDRGAEGILEWFHRRVIAQPPQLESRTSRKNYQDRVRAELRSFLGPAPDPVSHDTEWYDDLPGSGSRGVQRISFRSERDVRIPALWLPGAGEPPWPVVVALHPEGKSAALASPLVQHCREAGYAVLAPDVRLRGELKQEWFLNCVLWGRPEAGMAVDDTLACVDWLCEQEEVDPRTLLLLGEGDQGVVALLAAGLDLRVIATIADCCETTYRDGGDGLPVIPNVLRTADVPQIASLVAPRPLWLYRVPEERVGFSSRRYYDWTRRTYQSLGEPDALKMATGPFPDTQHLSEWLRKRIRRAQR